MLRVLLIVLSSQLFRLDVAQPQSAKVMPSLFGSSPPVS